MPVPKILTSKYHPQSQEGIYLQKKYAQRRSLSLLGDIQFDLRHKLLDIMSRLWISSITSTSLGFSRPSLIPLGHPVFALSLGSERGKLSLTRDLAVNEYG